MPQRKFSMVGIHSSHGKLAAGSSNTQSELSGNTQSELSGWHIHHASCGYGGERFVVIDKQEI